MLRIFQQDAANMTFAERSGSARMQEDQMARTINLFAAVAALALGLTVAAAPARAAGMTACHPTAALLVGR